MFSSAALAAYISIALAEAMVTTGCPTFAHPEQTGQGGSGGFVDKWRGGNVVRKAGLLSVGARGEQ